MLRDCADQLVHREKNIGACVEHASAICFKFRYLIK
jgi:hypothetical protein